MEGTAAAARLLADPASDARSWWGGAERRAGAWGGGAAGGLGWDGRRRRGRFALTVGDEEKCVTNARYACHILTSLVGVSLKGVIYAYTLE